MKMKKPAISRAYKYFYCVVCLFCYLLQLVILIFLLRAHFLELVEQMALRRSGGHFFKDLPDLAIGQGYGGLSRIDGR